MGDRINLIAQWRGIWRLLPVAAIFLILLDTPAQAQQIKFLAFGDSLTAGYGLAKAEGFTEQLQNALRSDGQAGKQTEGQVGRQAGRDIVVINAGVSGDTSAGGRSRLGWALADKPDAVLLELGANDGLRGIDPKVTRENLDAILSRLAALKIPVLLAGMKAPPNLGEDYGREYSAVFNDLSARYDVVFYPFFLEGVAGKPALNQDDGIHPNPEGVAAVVARILPAVRELLARVR